MRCKKHRPSAQLPEGGLFRENERRRNQVCRSRTQCPHVDRRCDHAGQRRGQKWNVYPLVKKVLAGKSPRARAIQLVSGTKLKDVEFRKNGKSVTALRAARDPMFDLARMIDKPTRETRKTHKTQEEIKRQAYAEIAKARFAVEGTSTYPDATFTLRLSHGKVTDYEEDGKEIPSFTDFAGLSQRATEHDNKPPFELPQRWIDRKAQLNLMTKFNFVSDADIIGGNSGSPVVNKAYEFVGIIFDGNIQSLVLDCIFSDKQARAVSVDSAAITEVLGKIYDAGALADELEKGMGD
jgi:Peptidase S46